MDLQAEIYSVTSRNQEKQLKPPGKRNQKSEDAADQSAEAENGDEDSSDEDIAEEAPAEDTGDEVLVETGESAEVAVSGSGEATGISKETAVAQENGIQEVSIPEFAKLNVQIGFTEAVTTNSIQESAPVVVSRQIEGDGYD